MELNVAGCLLALFTLKQHYKIIIYWAFAAFCQMWTAIACRMTCLLSFLFLPSHIFELYYYFISFFVAHISKICGCFYCWRICLYTLRWYCHLNFITIQLSVSAWVCQTAFINMKIKLTNKAGCFLYGFSAAFFFFFFANKKVLFHLFQAHNSI